MKNRFSFSAYTFAFSFVSISAVLALGFFDLNATLKARVKQGIKENLHHAEHQFDHQEAISNRRDSDLIDTLGQNASLKESIQLLEQTAIPASHSHARIAVESQLRDLTRGLGFDLVMVIDAGGEVVSTTGTRIEDAEARLVSQLSPRRQSLIRLGEGKYYEMVTVPISMDSENLGRLVCGKLFDLRSHGAFGDTVLVNQGKIVASTLPNILNSDIQRQLYERCRQGMDECEIMIGNQNYLTLAIGGAGLGPKYKMLNLVSMDDAMGGGTQDLRHALIITGFAAIIAALLMGFVAPRSSLKPSTDLDWSLSSSQNLGAVESCRPHLATVEFDLLALMSQTMQALEGPARKKGLKVACDVRPDVPEIVVGDESSLRNILLNLCDNAVKFTERGEVSIRVEAQPRDQGEWLMHFIVQDTGVGIPEDKQRIIFDSFLRANQSTKRLDGGEVHGLYDSFRQVRTMQGHLWVESKVGFGSQFHFTARLDSPPQSGFDDFRKDRFQQGLDDDRAA